MTIPVCAAILYVVDNPDQPAVVQQSSAPIDQPHQAGASYGKSSWKKWLLICLVIAAALSGGYWLFLSRSNTQPPFQSQKQCEDRTGKKCSRELCQEVMGGPPATGCQSGWYPDGNRPLTKTPQPTQVQDETASWKTYTNIQYGYSLKYPPELNIRSSIETEAIERARILILGNPTQPGIGIVGGVNKKDDESLLMTANRDLALYGSPTISVVNEKPIDSHPAIYLEASIMFNNKQAKQYYVYIEKNSALAVSLYSQPTYSGNEGAKTLFDQILSTFRFDTLTTSKFTDQVQTIDTSTLPIKSQLISPDGKRKITVKEDTQNGATLVTISDVSVNNEIIVDSQVGPYFVKQGYWSPDSKYVFVESHYGHADLGELRVFASSGKNFSNGMTYSVVPTVEPIPVFGRGKVNPRWISNTQIEFESEQGSTYVFDVEKKTVNKIK